MTPEWLIHPHQRCGYSDSPFARIYFFYTAGSRNRFEGMESVCTRTQKQKIISKGSVFLIEKCFEDARQDEKHVPDLLESIIPPIDPVKEELRQKLFQIDTIWIKNQENEGFKILDSGISKFSRRRPTQPSRPVGFKQETAFQIAINPIFGPARGQIYEKMRVIAL